MSDDKVRVRARGTALCPDFDAMDRDPPLRRSLGRKYQEIAPGKFAWVPSGQAEAVTKRAEIARAIADGDLFAADQATADWAHATTRVSITFDPTFGGAVTNAPTAPAPSVDGSVVSDKAGKAGKAGS